jgi:hypothetical protein
LEGQYTRNLTKGLRLIFETADKSIKLDVFRVKEARGKTYKKSTVFSWQLLTDDEVVNKRV